MFLTMRCRLLVANSRREFRNERRRSASLCRVINERRNQLHEVIRLSGMNLVINDTDHPLIIKVASIQPVRMQVYFIDNEDLFQKKYMVTDKSEDNFTADEKSIFFSKGVVETVKKLGWAPNIVHCHGWFSAIFPFMMRKVYKYDPLFANNCKVVYTIYNDRFSGSINKDFAKKLVEKEAKIEDLERISDPTWENITKLAIDYSDGVILGSQDIDPEIIKYIKDSGKPMLEYSDNDTLSANCEQFYSTVIEKQD